VVVNIKITEVAKYKPIISGETNLPDGTIMEAAIFGKIRRSHYEGSVCTVSEGKFSFQGFGKSNGIEPGKYVATISSKSPASQNVDVKKVIGEQGGRKTQRKSN